MSSHTSSGQPIGVYDSGVGGLSVLRAIQALLPHEDLIYLGDQAKVPYGGRSLEELRDLALGITRFLLDQGAKVIVIACNTASAAALRHLRQVYPEIPFVGMEPAVKPAAEQTLTGKVGVLATPSTFQGELYASVVERFASGVEIYQETCPGLVSQIEKGRLRTPKTRAILEHVLIPLLDKGVDTLVMGCTHFPFVIPLIEEISAGRARVIDPAPAVAHQLARVLEQHGLTNPGNAPGTTSYYTTGDPKKFERILPRLIGTQAGVSALKWNNWELSPFSPQDEE
ncbi:MAG: glutamate racemase [Anaerolineaceae bacterium]